MDPPNIAREPSSPLERARVLRQNALQRCAVGAYPECVAALDQARDLDPSGENASAIRDARAAAASSERARAIPNLPAGGAPTSVPETQPSPKQQAPQKALPKPIAPHKAQPNQVAPSKPPPNQVAPSKLQPNQVAPSKVEPLNVAPSQRIQSPDDAGGNELPTKGPRGKKL
jgi:hypothetical protein